MLNKNISYTTAQMPDEGLSMWRHAGTATVFNGATGPLWNIYVRSTKVTPEDMVDDEGQLVSDIECYQVAAITSDKSICVELTDFIGSDSEANENSVEYCIDNFPVDINVYEWMCDVLASGAEDVEIQPAFEIPTDLVCHDPAWAKPETFVGVQKASRNYTPFLDESDPAHVDSEWMHDNLLYYNGCRMTAGVDTPVGMEFARHVVPTVGWRANWNCDVEDQVRTEIAHGLYDATYIFGPKFVGEIEDTLQGDNVDSITALSPRERISVFQTLRKCQQMRELAAVACPDVSASVQMTDDGAFVTVVVVPLQYATNRALLLEIDEILAA